MKNCDGGPVHWGTHCALSCEGESCLAWIHMAGALDMPGHLFPCYFLNSTKPDRRDSGLFPARQLDQRMEGLGDH